MNYDAVIASGVRDLSRVRQFQQLFPDAEHTIVESKRASSSEGWKTRV